MRTGLVRVLAVLLAAAGNAALAAPPPPCAPGRFVVQGSPLLGFGSDGSDAVIISSGQVSTATGCTWVDAKIRGVKKGTRVRARWTAGCGIWTRRIILTALIEPTTCATMTGLFKFRDTNGTRVRRGFTAQRVTSGTCQDGGIDTFALIQSRVFYARGCNVSTCHGPFAQGGLDLSQEAAWLNLVNVAANNPTANAAGKLRVQPGSANGSFLSQKLRGALLPGEGSQMPLIGPPLPANEVALIDAWIRGGAPATGRVADAPCLLPNEYVPTPAPPAPAGGYQIRLDGPVLQPGQEQEGCMWVQVPNATDFAVGKWEFALNPGTHHFAIFPYEGSGTPADAQRLAGERRRLHLWRQLRQLDRGRTAGAILHAGVPGRYRACPDRRHVDRPQRALPQLLAGADPDQGVERHLPLSRDAGSSGADDHRLHRHVLDQRAGEHAAHPAGPLAQYRRRAVPGLLCDGTHASARAPLHRVALRRHEIYENFDFAHPIFRQFVPPLVIPSGDWIDYECLHDNGVTRPVRRDSLGNPTTLLFGVTTEDEMCTLNGEFYTQ